MISLVECFPEQFRFIPTTIGNEYGDIYEMQFETARASKLNHAIVPKFYQTHMKPVMNMRKVQVPKLWEKIKVSNEDIPGKWSNYDFIKKFNFYFKNYFVQNKSKTY